MKIKTILLQPRVQLLPPLLSYSYLLFFGRAKFFSSTSKQSSSSLKIRCTFRASLAKGRKILNIIEEIRKRLFERNVSFFNSFDWRRCDSLSGKIKDFGERRLHGWPPCTFFIFRHFGRPTAPRLGQSVQLDSVNRYQWSQKGAALRNSSTTTLSSRSFAFDKTSPPFYKGCAVFETSSKSIFFGYARKG